MGFITTIYHHLLGKNEKKSKFVSLDAQLVYVVTINIHCWVAGINAIKSK